MSPRPTKKRLGKKHRQASTRPKKGRAPRNPPATGAQTSAASPRKRKLLAARRAEQEKKRRTPTRSPEHESRKTVSKQPRPSRSLSTDNEQRTTHNDPDPESPEEVRAWDRAEQLATQFDLTNPSNLEPRTANLPLIAICGRPNVGKSTLFNRLTGSRRSIVGDEPGITRDRIYGLIDWANRAARLVDTGGIVPDDPSLIPAEIFHQAQTALTEADAIIMVIDGRTELASPDRDLARLLLRTGKPLFLAVNKIDTAALAPAAENFRRLGFRNVVPISAEHGSGIGDLLDDVFATLPTQSAAISPEPVILAQPESPYLPSTDNQPGAPSLSAGQGGSAATEDDSVILSEPHSGESKRPSQQSVILSEPHSGESKDLHLAHPATAARRPSAPEFPSAPSHPSELTTDHLPLTTDRPRLLRSHGAYVETETRIAIIGRPNVGKSTLLNALTGSDRAIVSPIAGTTRDAVDELVTRAGHDFRFVDTAGIRRKGKTRLMAEKLSVVMARKHLEAADVSLLVLDATAGVTALDATIGGYAHESGRSVILVVNKWDLVTQRSSTDNGQRTTDNVPHSRVPHSSPQAMSGSSATVAPDTKSASSSSAWDAKRSGSSAAPVDKRLYEQQIRDALKFLDYAPIVFVSAASATGLDALYKKIELVARERRKRVTTGQMNRFLARVNFQRASVPMKRRVKIYYMTQAAVAPPTFVLFTDKDVKLHFAFERFLANQIRETFGFIGSPIWFKTRPRNKKKPEE